MIQPLSRLTGLGVGGHLLHKYSLVQHAGLSHIYI